MKTAAWISGLALAGLGLALPSPAQALAFPLEYTGQYELSVTVSNAYGSGMCFGQAAMTISLQSDRTLNYRVVQLEAVLHDVSGQPASCEVRLRGTTYEVEGSHDLQGHYSIPSGSPGLPPLTGHYDEDHLTGSYQYGPSSIAFDLPAVSHLIAFEPDPGQGFEFHHELLAGKGFKLVMRDPHGREHLDLDTLKILVGPKGMPGTDTTAYAQSRLMNGIVPFTDESPDSRTRVFHLKPDPQRLMQGHDIFAIPYNGDWRIELRLCDKAGTCFGRTYDVYVGPFVSSSPVLDVVDGRCASHGDSLVKVSRVVVGNIGIDSPHAAIFIGLTRASDGDTWTFHADEFGDGTGGYAWWQGSIVPFVPLLSMPSGFLLEQDEFEIPDWRAVLAGAGPAYQRRIPFPDGIYRLVTTAVDADTGAFRRFERDVRMCDR